MSVKLGFLKGYSYGISSSKMSILWAELCVAIYLKLLLIDLTLYKNEKELLNWKVSLIIDLSGWQQNQTSCSHIRHQKLEIK